jgi:hypothetical protein
MHGFEGIDFEWEGEPYASRVMQSGGQYLNAFMHHGTLSFHTNIYDGNAGTIRYSLGDNALTRFAQSAEGRRMVIKPTRHDVAGVFTPETEALNEAHWEGLLSAVQTFYWNAVTGAINIDAEWQRYINDLNNNGLQEYIALMEKFPRTE